MCRQLSGPERVSHVNHQANGSSGAAAIIGFHASLSLPYYSTDTYNFTESLYTGTTESQKTISP